MTSTSAVEPSSAMEETRNWLEMPDEIMGGMILQRLGALEILESAHKVCTSWRRICKDPVMWKVIIIDHSLHTCDMDDVIEKLIKQALHRSCGELIDISLVCFGSDQLLDYISQSSSKLNCLRLTHCYDITGRGLNNALEGLPHLEALELSYMSIDSKDIEVIGLNCPQLKSFKLEADFMDSDSGDFYAIVNSMPALRHLQLVGSTISDDEIQAILKGCPHLESLDVCDCLYLDHLNRNLEKLCRERIKDFKCDMEFIDYDDTDGREDLPDMMLSFASQCNHGSSKLNSLRLTKCHGITGSGLIHALKRLPHLEALSLFYTPIDAEDLKVIGPICPQLKSFKIKTWFSDCEGDPDVIANTMPALRHLQLFGTTIMDGGVYAILDGFPHLESLDVRSFSYFYVDRNLEKLCRERIKDFKFTVNLLFESSPEAYAHEDCEFSDSGPDSFYGDYEFSAGNVISP